MRQQLKHHSESKHPKYKIDIHYSTPNFLFAILLEIKLHKNILLPPRIFLSSSFFKKQTLHSPNRGAMVAADLDLRSSALDNLHALLKSDKISKRRVSRRVSFLLACLRDDFLFFGFSVCKSHLNEIHPSRGRFRVILDTSLFPFY